MGVSLFDCDVTSATDAETGRTAEDSKGRADEATLERRGERRCECISWNREVDKKDWDDDEAEVDVVTLQQSTFDSISRK